MKKIISIISKYLMRLELILLNQCCCAQNTVITDVVIETRYIGGIDMLVFRSFVFLSITFFLLLPSQLFAQSVEKFLVDVEILIDELIDDEMSLFEMEAELDSSSCPFSEGSEQEEWQPTPCYVPDPRLDPLRPGYQPPAKPSFPVLPYPSDPGVTIPAEPKPKPRLGFGEWCVIVREGTSEIRLICNPFEKKIGLHYEWIF